MNIRRHSSFDGHQSTMCIFGYSSDALEKNQELEFERNRERFMFLKVFSFLPF